jgi:glycosyltransferase involved in cell wall biosynthesis
MTKNKSDILVEPVSILMPVCNEADVIEEVVEEWRRDVICYLPAGSQLIIEDCSNDGTEKILTQLGKKYEFLKVYFAPRDGFFNSALRLYRYAQTPLVFFTDSDGQYVAADFWKVAAYIDNHDMVHGWKQDRKDPGYRIRASGIYNIIARLMFSSRAQDVNSAFRLMRKPMLNVVLGQITRLKMLPNSELYLRAEASGFRILNVPVSHQDRKYGKSRSLPASRFVKECWRAFFGLVQLRGDLAKSRGG